MDYEDARSGDIVVLKVSNRNQPTWFLLRTHDEKIESISGGEFQRLEKDAYLIKVLEDTVTIELEKLGEFKVGVDLAKEKDMGISW